MALILATSLLFSYACYPALALTERPTLLTLLYHVGIASIASTNLHADRKPL